MDPQSLAVVTGVPTLAIGGVIKVFFGRVGKAALSVAGDVGVIRASFEKMETRIENIEKMLTLVMVKNGLSKAAESEVQSGVGTL